MKAAHAYTIHVVVHRDGLRGKDVHQLRRSVREEARLGCERGEVQRDGVVFRVEPGQEGHVARGEDRELLENDQCQFDGNIS